jgi:hypothetical protein
MGHTNGLLRLGRGPTKHCAIQRKTNRPSKQMAIGLFIQRSSRHIGSASTKLTANTRSFIRLRSRPSKTIAPTVVSSKATKPARSARESIRLFPECIANDMHSPAQLYT